MVIVAIRIGISNTNQPHTNPGKLAKQACSIQVCKLFVPTMVCIDLTAAAYLNYPRLNGS